MIDHSPLAPVGFWKYVKQGIIFQSGSRANSQSQSEIESVKNWSWPALRLRHMQLP